MNDAPTRTGLISKESELHLGLGLMLVSFLPTFVAVGLAPTLPQIELHFASVENANFLTKALMTVIGPSGIIGAILTPFFLRKLGYENTLIFCCITFAIVGASGVFIDNLHGLVAMRFLVGFVASLGLTACFAVVATQFEPDARNRWFGYLLMGGGAMAIGIIILSGMIGQYDWRKTSLIHFAAVPILVVSIRGLRRCSSDLWTDTAELGGSHRIVHSRFPYWLLLLSIVCGCIVYSPNIYAPFLLNGMGIISSIKIGNCLIAAATCAAISSFWFGTVRRYLSLKATFVIAFGLCGVGYLALFIAPIVEIAVSGLALIGAGVGLLAPNLLVVATTLGANAELKSRNIAVAKAGLLAGPFVGQMVLSAAFSGSPTAPILTLGVLCMVTAIAAVSLNTVTGDASKTISN